ncbi:MAG: efflux RND transporter permease subunit [Pirellulaceae bacterium]
MIAQTIIETPSGRRVSLGEVVDVLDTTGPNTLNREHVQRRIVAFCNVQARLSKRCRRHSYAYSTDREAACEICPEIITLNTADSSSAARRELTTPNSRQPLRRGSISAAHQMPPVVASRIAGLGQYPTGRDGFNYHPADRQSAIGGGLSRVAWWQWPSVWIGATTLSVAHWVGFITLIGIVSRNGIMMISHYMHLMEHEGEKFGEAMIIRAA